MNGAALHDALRQWLSSRWQGLYENAQGVLIIPRIGPTACMVEVQEAPRGRTAVNVRAPMLLNVPETPELLGYVAYSGVAYSLGSLALSVDPAGGVNLEFSYTALADLLQAEQANVLVEIVASSAIAELEKGGQEAFGGRTPY